MPLASLYDTDKIIREWAKKGFRVQLTPPLLELPAFEEPDQAFPRCATPHLAARHATLAPELPLTQACCRLR